MSVKDLLMTANLTALVDSLVANKLDNVLNATGKPQNLAVIEFDSNFINYRSSHDLCTDQRSFQSHD